MKGGFRASMTWLHTGLGLVFGWLLFVILLTGSLSVFDRAITDWMQTPPSSFWLGLWSPEFDERLTRSSRYTHGGWHFIRLHFTLHVDMIGIWIVGLVTMGMMTAIVTGVIAHVRIFRDLFTFRPGRGGRSWLDAHTALGVAVLPFLVMIAYTGLVLFYSTYMPAGFMARYGGDRGFRQELYAQPADAPAGRTAPLFQLTGHPPLYQSPEGRPESLARSTRQAMVSLHLIQFGGAEVRWLYFLSGLLGAATVAAGLMLYTVKRRRRHEEAGTAPGRLFRLVEGLNCATVAGLCVAVAAYFWANRLIPVGGADRAAQELLVFAGVWAACAGHANLRPARAAWREQLAAAALLLLALPFLNALTTSASVIATASAGDWRAAGVDLTMAAAGLLLAGAAVFARPRAQPAAAALAAREAAGAA
jgi:uncharacterized iron-regulated membrane protein